MLARLPGRAHSDPDIRCIVAFARMGQGRYHEALAALPRAHELTNGSAATKQLCTFVAATARKGLGLVDAAQLTELLREARAVAPDSMLSIQTELHEARDRYLVCREPEQARAQFEEFRVICDRVRTASADDEHTQLIVSITQWESRGIGLSGNMMNMFAGRNMQIALGVPMSPQFAGDLERLQGERNAWQAEVVGLEEQVRKNGSPFLQADLALSYGRVHAQHLFVVHGLAAIGMSRPAVPRDVTLTAVARVRWAAGVLEHLRCLEYACRSRLLEAELCDCLDDETGRSDAARRARELAQEIDNVVLVGLAEDSVAGRFPVREFERALKSVRPDAHNDADLMSPEDRDRLTRDVLRSLGIPQDRFAVARRCFEDDATAARERRTFCRHLQLREEPVPRDPATLYLRAPGRQACCAVLGFMSRDPNDDGSRVINAFKSVHCARCDRREPAT
jgi:hypothetical protein